MLVFGHLRHYCYIVTVLFHYLFLLFMQLFIHKIYLFIPVIYLLVIPFTSPNIFLLTRHLIMSKLFFVDSLMTDVIKYLHKHYLRVESGEL